MSCKYLRKKLSIFALNEAQKNLRGNDNFAGPQIEPYLSVFRDAMNKNASTNEYSDLKVGYPWCCAFVYYCCLKIGISIPQKPVSNYRYTLAAVPAWKNWAENVGIYYKKGIIPGLGDIALFNNVYCDKPLDHIGIVVEINDSYIISAEGNNKSNNQSGLYQRKYEVIDGYVRINKTSFT